MKYIAAMLLGAMLHVGISEVLDLNEAKRYTQCTLETNDYDKCQESSTWLYRNYPYRLDLYDCVFPGGKDRYICKLFNIKRSL